MRISEQPHAKTPQQLPRRIKFQNRWIRSIPSQTGRMPRRHRIEAAVKHPDVAVAMDMHPDHLAPVPSIHALRNRRPPLRQPVRIGQLRRLRILSDPKPPPPTQPSQPLDSPVTSRTSSLQLQPENLRAFLGNFEVARHRIGPHFKRMRLSSLAPRQHLDLRNRSVELRMIRHQHRSVRRRRGRRHLPLRIECRYRNSAQCSEN